MLDKQKHFICEPNQLHSSKNTYAVISMEYEQTTYLVRLSWGGLSTSLHTLLTKQHHCHCMPYQLSERDQDSNLAHDHSQPNTKTPFRYTHAKKNIKSKNSPHNQCNHFINNHILNNFEPIPTNTSLIFNHSLTHFFIYTHIMYTILNSNNIYFLNEIPLHWKRSCG